MFSEKSKRIIEMQYRQLLTEMPVLQQESGRFTGLKEEVAIAMKYLYNAMPFSDISNYSFDTFLDYAENGMYLWNQSAFGKEIPESVFLPYILYHRVNDEEILPCRSLFHKLLAKRVKGLTRKEAVIEVNYWCTEEASYRSTDERTAASLTVYRCGYGRCGEESAFFVSALRSIGIPARQVYAPRWSHCDDNHAWVEAWCDGKWYFTGACEPEEILNKGWFNSASSRAMLIHSRLFNMPLCGIRSEKCEEKTFSHSIIHGSGTDGMEEIIGKAGMAVILNQLGRYAFTKEVAVRIKDMEGHPVRAAQVEFQILNYSEFYPIAVVSTDEDGKAYIRTGLGSMNIHVAREQKAMDILVDTRLQNQIDITFQEDIQKEDCWQAFDMIAPLDRPVNTDMPSSLQKKEGTLKLEKANDKRLSKLKKVRNTEIETFINLDSIEKKLKEKMSGILTSKDRNDCKEDILKEHFQYALPYKDFYKEEIFIKYILNPRILNEPLYNYRKLIHDFFSAEEKKCFQKKPVLIWEWINSHIQSHDGREYPNLVTLPSGCLRTGTGSNLSKSILFAAIARSLGIPARLRITDRAMEYYFNGEFLPVFQSNTETAVLTLLGGKKSMNWIYYQNYSIAVYQNNSYTTIHPESEDFVKGRLKLSLKPGKYRIITSNRLPNGNIFASRYILNLKAGEEKEVVLSMREARLKDMLENLSMNDFNLLDETGNIVTGSEITKEGKKILLWLEEGMEPTEHILNELLERKEDFREFSGDLYLILKSKKSLEHPAVSEVLKAFPKAGILYDDFKENVQTLCRRLYVDPDKLPLIAVTGSRLNAIYAASGYNVGTGDLLLRLLKEQFD